MSPLPPQEPLASYSLTPLIKTMRTPGWMLRNYRNASSPARYGSVRPSIAR